MVGDRGPVFAGRFGPAGRRWARSRRGADDRGGGLSMRGALAAVAPAIRVADRGVFEGIGSGDDSRSGGGFAMMLFLAAGNGGCVAGPCARNQTAARPAAQQQATPM